MKELNINKDFMLWFLEIVENIIVDSIEDNPTKFPTLLAVNELINKLNLEEGVNISNVIGELTTNKIFEEVKNNI